MAKFLFALFLIGVDWGSWGVHVTTPYAWQFQPARLLSLYGNPSSTSTPPASFSRLVGVISLQGQGGKGVGSARGNLIVPNIHVLRCPIHNREQAQAHTQLTIAARQ